jgi:hypothetical protein
MVIKRHVEVKGSSRSGESNSWDTTGKKQKVKKKWKVSCFSFLSLPPPFHFSSLSSGSKKKSYFNNDVLKSVRKMAASEFSWFTGSARKCICVHTTCVSQTAVWAPWARSVSFVITPHCSEHLKSSPLKPKTTTVNKYWIGYTITILAEVHSSVLTTHHFLVLNLSGCKIKDLDSIIGSLDGENVDPWHLYPSSLVLPRVVRCHDHEVLTSADLLSLGSSASGSVRDLWVRQFLNT